LRATFDGLELARAEKDRPAITGDRLVQTKTSAANGTASFEFPVVVVGREKATLRFQAALGPYKDTVEITLPILNPGTHRPLVASKTVTASGEIKLEIPARLEKTGKLEILASSTSLSELKDAVQYLLQYPYGCIEQTTSTAYPLVVLKDLLPEIGVEV